ncbi:MAG: hypothetical protein OXF49_02375 [Candidatus Saccharibacteria bacterium]|nr:hypothetical protein [Candidatus Saccharibacteria bacterium]
MNQANNLEQKLQLINDNLTEIKFLLQRIAVATAVDMHINGVEMGYMKAGARKQQSEIAILDILDTLKQCNCQKKKES